MHKKKHIRAFILMAMLFVFFYSMEIAISEGKRPFSFGEIEGFLKDKNIPQEEMVNLITEFGVNFDITVANIKAMKNLGADNSIIDAILNVVEPKTNILIVNSEPLVNHFYINGDDRGSTTAYIIGIPPGEIQISTRGIKGHQDYDGKFEIKQGKVNELNIVLPPPSPIPPVIIPVNIFTEPPGANIKINSKDYGKSPLKNIPLKEGYHKLEINMEGEGGGSIAEIIEIKVGIKDIFRELTPPTFNIETSPDHDIYPGKLIEVKIIASKNLNSPIYTWGTDKGYFEHEKTTIPINCFVAPFEKGNVNLIVNINEQGGKCRSIKKTVAINNPDYQRNLGDYSTVRIHTNNIYSGYLKELNIFDVDFDSKNNMYILDPERKGISIFDPNGKYLRTLCEGKFTHPKEILIEKDKIYIIYSNFNNNFVQKYDLSGNQELQLNNVGTDKVDFKAVRNPVNIAIGNKGEIFVIDRIGKNPSIGVFNANGTYSKHFGGGDGELKTPVSIGIDSNDYIYVLDSENTEILVYTPQMNFQRRIKLDTSEVVDMYLDKKKDQLYLLNKANKNILVMDTSGNVIHKFGNPKNPWKIALDIFDNVYSTSYEPGSSKESFVYKFEFKENNYNYYGKYGTNPFEKIKNIAVCRDSSIFLLNESNTIIKVDKDGWELNRFNLDSRGDAIVAGGEYVYVLDTEGKGILQYSNSGKRLNRFSATEKPIEIDSDNEGNLYVIYEKTDICSVYNPLGISIGSIGTKWAGEKNKESYLLYNSDKIAVERDSRRAYIYDEGSWRGIKSKINIYEKSGSGVSSPYPFLEVKDVGKIFMLKVNNYNRLMVVFHSDMYKISFLNVNNIVEERTLSLGDSNKTIKVKDIEVDGVENIYVLDNASNVHIFKQQKLLQE